MFRTMALALIVVAALALPVVAFAQATHTVTITEEQINNSYVVTNPPSRVLTDVYVDIQEGQAVISATYRRPGQRAQAITATYVAGIAHGHVVWRVQSATVDGEPASPEVVAAIDDALRRAFHHAVRRWYMNCFYDDYAATSVTLANDAVTITFIEVY